ncbi:MAG TPA: DUF2059 domain-containing protein [Dongiaceae bacterium]|jgi:hypothetical protein
MTAMRSRLALALLLLGLLFSFALVSGAQAADAVDPAMLAKARAVALASAPAEQRVKMLSALTMQFSRYLGSANPGRELEVDDLVQAYFVPLINARYGEIIDVGAREYAKDFTPAELDRLLAFYQSSLGKKLVASQGKLDPIISKQGPVIAQSIANEAIQKMAPEMKKRGLVLPQ